MVTRIQKPQLLLSTISNNQRSTNRGRHYYLWLCSSCCIQRPLRVQQLFVLSVFIVFLLVRGFGTTLPDTSSSSSLYQVGSAPPLQEKVGIETIAKKEPAQRRDHHHIPVQTIQPDQMKVQVKSDIKKADARVLPVRDPKEELQREPVQTIIQSGRVQDQSPRRRVKPYFKNADVHILHVGDRKFTDTMAHHLNRTHQWIDCTGYKYRLEEVAKPKKGERPCIYTLKVERVLKVLEEIPYHDWLIFLDMDVQYQAPTCDALEKMLPLKSKRNSQPCEFIALAGNHTINTGVILIQATNATRQLVRRWYEVEQRMALCNGPADQISLQEVMLEEMTDNYDGSCAMNNTVIFNNDDAHAANICFGNHLPAEKRSMGNICMLGCNDRTPLQCHDCTYHCQVSPSTIFYHAKRRPGGRPPLVG